MKEYAKDHYKMFKQINKPLEQQASSCFYSMKVALSYICVSLGIG